MPPGDTDVTMKQDRTSITPGEQVLSPLALAQSYLGLDAFRSAAGDPRVRMATVESSIQQRTKELQDAQKDLNFYQTHWDLYKGAWTGGMDVTKQALNLAKQKVGSLQESIANMEAEKSILPDQVKEFQQTQEMSNLVEGRLKSFLSGEDLGVSPEERRLISEGISGISQDVATSRGLNRTDVPVMQAVAPAVSQALLAQANANRSLLTGMNQFNQGMGLSNRQLQMGLAGQNPAASLTGVYAGLAPGGQNQSGSRGLGGADVMSMFGQGAMGTGLGLYGLGASGLLSSGAVLTPPAATSAALSTYGGSMAMGCWIAEAIYGTNAPETGVVRWWLNVHFAKQPVGRVVMALYGKYGRWMAGYVQRWAWLRQVLRPIFDMALRRGLATG